MSKQKKIKFMYSKYLPFLLIFATFFMSIGYAQINGVQLNIEGTAESILQEGVFISDATYLSNVGADISNSKINYYFGTMLDSEVVLGSTLDSTITYKISLYNNSDKNYLFIGVLTDEDNNILYSNDNIEISLNGIQEYVTTIEPNQSLDFTITFKYIDKADVSKNTLSSKLNFRFQESPELTLSNDNNTYTLNNIYPNYTSQEYEFTVTNYDGKKVNNVPMTYYFETTIDSPLTAKIYDEDGNEIKDSISIEGDGQQKVTHTYTLKIIWDDSNTDNGIAYNSSEYADKVFDCNISLKAIPDSDKYLDYELTKGFDVDITTHPLYFYFDADSSINVEKSGSDLEVTINNYNSSTEYNQFDIDYEISIADNDKFTLSDDDGSSSSSVITKTLSGGEAIDDSYNIKLIADINNLDVTENLTLNIYIKSPYVSQITHSLTLNLQPVKVTLNPNGGSVSTSSLTVYKGKTYGSLPTPTWTGHTFNGWYTTSEGGTKIANTTEVTTSNSTQTLYAQWTSHLLVDNVSTGDYVAYNVAYNNVATNTNGTHYAKLTGWRVLDVQEDENGDKYVRLITAGVPMAYRHAASSTTSGKTGATNLTTGFFSTAISSISASNSFNACGFQNDLGTIITIGTLKKLFANNEYTQVVDGTPKVQSITNDDIESVLNITVTNEKDIRGNDLFAIPSSDQTSAYASYYLAESASSYYLWVSYYSGYIVYTYAYMGVRPVVSLKTTVLTSGKTNGVWQIYI